MSAPRMRSSQASLKRKIANAAVMGLQVIQAYKVMPLGCQNAQYFPGATAIGSGFDEVVVGSGDTLQEAYEQAVYLLSDLDIDTAYMPTRPANITSAPMSREKAEAGDFAFFVQILYTLNASKRN